MALLGALLADKLDAHLGVPVTVALGNVVYIAGAIGLGLRLPSLRQEARQIIAALR
jgi:dipeptide/tripeptide permease